MNPRLHAVYELDVADARENLGRHEYDGVVQDLSPAGVRSALDRLGDGPGEEDPYDESLLRVGEENLRIVLGELEEHRRNPLYHIANLDLACYDRPYAPAEVRDAARRRHLAAWPDAVDAAVEALDRIPRDVAAAMLGPARGLAAAVDADDPANADALAAHDRLVTHIAGFAEQGEPDPALGADAFARLLGAGEGMTVDVGALAGRAEAEAERLRAAMTDACAQLEPDVDPAVLVAELVGDHPDEPDAIHAEARTLMEEADAFTRAHDLLTVDGECRVEPAPPSRAWAMAMMAWAGPYEPEAPSIYYVTPPDPSWPREQQEEWLQVFSRTTLPAITVHEVTPGHFAHGRAMRRLTSDARRSILSYAFVEGWAHYAEELFVEEGFRAADPRFAIGVILEALLRVTRFAVALGVHTAGMSVAEATDRFTRDAYLQGPAARSEAVRATFDPTYGRYTWGKLEIMRLRSEARRRWGSAYSHRRFHEAMLGLGAPPLGLLDRALAD